MHGPAQRAALSTTESPDRSVCHVRGMQPQLLHMWPLHCSSACKTVSRLAGVSLPGTAVAVIFHWLAVDYLQFLAESCCRGLPRLLRHGLGSLSCLGCTCMGCSINCACPGQLPWTAVVLCQCLSHALFQVSSPHCMRQHARHGQGGLGCLMHLCLSGRMFHLLYHWRCKGYTYMHCVLCAFVWGCLHVQLWHNKVIDNLHCALHMLSVAVLG